MSSISSFFLALLHFFALAWATIHPTASPKHAQPSAYQTTSQVKVRFQNRLTPRVVLASMRSADSGYWHTSGSRILDDRGRQMRIEGINWYGFETVRGVPGGLTVQDYRTVLETIRHSGFNSVRIPL